MGPAAHRFIEWLAASGCTLWQVLPVGPTGYGNSPYQCHSVFAGNPYLISPDFLLRDGWLTKEEVANRPGPVGANQAKVDFERALPLKLTLLKKAFARFKGDGSRTDKRNLRQFREENESWLEDLALYGAIKTLNRSLPWSKWPQAFRLRERGALGAIRRRLRASIDENVFFQFLFFQQWNELHQHARRAGILLIGDLPIFAAADSSDVWAHSDLFCLDEERPTMVAGVPPDYFAPTGQLWGNPLYNWDRHWGTGFSWWLARVQHQLRLFDALRLDHFRGFAGYWAVPAGQRTAESGRWLPGPGATLLDLVHAATKGNPNSDSLPLIAEDLGVLTPDVGRLLNRYRFPGMRILQFGLAGLQSEFLPHNFIENCVAYTGTHDNDTGRGWYQNAPKAEREFALAYLGTDETGVVRAMIRSIWTSVARYAIVPVQDLLELGSEARMNFPGRPEGNWGWRLEDGALSEKLGLELKALNAEGHRAEGETSPRR